MASKYYKISGTFNWIKNHTPDAEYDNFTIDVIPDEKGWEVHESAGMQVTPKEDKEGNRYVRYRRPNKKIIKDEMVTFGPPKTVGKNGEDLSGIMIANGAKGVVDVVVYDTRKGKGHRLEKITLHDWSEYNKVDPTDVRTMDTGEESTNVTELPKKKRPF